MKLKQFELLKLLAKENVSFGLYQCMLHAALGKHTKGTYAYIQTKPSKYILPDGNLSENGVKMLKRIEDLFITRKKISALSIMGDDYKSKIQQYLELFPTAKLPSGKYARGDKRGVEENFKWFFQEYDYTWDVILKATEAYVADYYTRNYQYMQTGMYFIKKENLSKTIVSELANWCEQSINGSDFQEEKIFKQRVF